MKSSIFSLFVSMLFSSVSFADSVKNNSQMAYELPKAEVRKAMILDLAKQVRRIDGEGLLPRENRPESWDKTVEKLSAEAAEAKSLYDFGRVFKRFDATYPNLHANVF